MEDIVMESMPDMPELKPGQVVKSKVVHVSGDRVLVDLGLKKEGSLSVSEFKKLPQVGAEIDIYINHLNNADGSPSISYSKAMDMVVWKKLNDSFAAKEIIKGKVGRKIKGGYEVDVGLTAFMPGSQVSKDNSKEPEGKTLGVIITELDKKSRNIVVSNKLAEKEINEVKRQNIFATIKEGDVIKGKISTITDFGIFVDIGGIDGLLHINDVSYKRVEKLNDIYKPGDEISVKVLKVDAKENKIALGAKQLLKNPWDDVETKYRKGMKVNGKITTLTPFGAFVMLEDGVEGLIHVSDISWTERIVHPKDIFKEGQEIEAVVLESSVDKQKISLSYKALFENPYDGYKIGKIVTGKIVKLMDFGCLVELEKHIHGFIHVSEIAKSRIEKPADVLSLEDTVTGKVVKVEKQKKRIEISIKQYEREQEEQDIKGFMNSQETRIKLADLIEDDN